MYVALFVVGDVYRHGCTFDIGNAVIVGPHKIAAEILTHYIVHLIGNCFSFSLRVVSGW